MKVKTAEAPASKAPAPKAPAPKAPAPKAPSTGTFRSAGKETHEITIMGIRATRGPDMKLTFTVPAADADRFARHHHCATGRVQRVDG